VIRRGLEERITALEKVNHTQKQRILELEIKSGDSIPAVNYTFFSNLAA
jgi:hypothetical protein